jgi:hypothetical protein
MMSALGWYLPAPSLTIPSDALNRKCKPRPAFIRTPGFHVQNTRGKARSFVGRFMKIQPATFERLMINIF